MTAHARKTYEAILGSPAPRDLEWTQFEAMWRHVAQEVEQESGDRLAVRVHGHREVFRRPHDGRVSIEDVERARHLLRSMPDVKSSGHLIAVAIDERRARILDFDLDAEQEQDSERDVKDRDTRSRHLRTVERHSGHEDTQLLNTFFDDVAAALTKPAQHHPVVVLGHGHGKSNAAADFISRLREKHPELAAHIAGVGDVDLSSDNDAELEAKAVQVARAHTGT